MKCPHCQHENPEGSKSCLECGRKMEFQCPQCGTSLPSTAKFCNECGCALSEARKIPAVDYSQPQSYTPRHLKDKILTTRSAIEGKRKLVTVLFANVAHYTAMSEKLDRTLTVYSDLHRKEGVQSKVKQYLNKAAKIFKKCNADGWVEKYEKELAALS